MASTYSTFEYYSGTYGGTLSEAQYTPLSVQAAGEINRRTFGRALSAPETMTDALCMCECELVDALNGFSESYSLLPAGLHSINNDGLSVTADSGSGATRAKTESSTVRMICQKWLMWPVNLMYRGLGQC